MATARAKPGVGPEPARPLVELKFVLPWGVSANAYWRSLRKGRMAGLVLLSREARQYRLDVRECLANQGIRCVELSGSLEIEMIANPPTRREFDLDNRIKPLLDALSHCGLIEDDKYFRRIVIELGTIVPGGSVEVYLRQKSNRAPRAAQLELEA